ncbi:hypothetical protein BV898_18473 [Hypsibius exemplaris]|uniref:Uncharacterized protein n=1 Tax=Hypsibius exemplaris TaxID=2072580 RepID=A0A9X6RNV8_HYPEX|nr:hypothetical protein BV898_18473 [Hypsibius exemplaris]
MSSLSTIKWFILCSEESPTATPPRGQNAPGNKPYKLEVTMYQIINWDCRSRRSCLPKHRLKSSLIPSMANRWRMIIGTFLAVQRLPERERSFLLLRTVPAGRWLILAAVVVRRPTAARL